MNVVPRSTGNTNSGTRELTLKLLTLLTYFLFAAIHHLKSSPTFSVRPCSSVGRVTVDLIRRSWVRFPAHRGQKIFSLPRVVPCFPLLGLTPSGLFMGLSST